jgi:hypothetical protein
MVERRSGYSGCLVAKPEGYTTFERARHRWENNTTVDVQEICTPGFGLESYGVAWGWNRWRALNELGAQNVGKLLISGATRLINMAPAGQSCLIGPVKLRNVRVCINWPGNLTWLMTALW